MSAALTGFGARARTLATAVVFALLVAAAVASTANAAPTYRGVQLHSLWSGSSTADMDRELDLVQKANANVIRIDVGWSSLEQDAKGKINTWYQDRVDYVMNGAANRGIKVIMLYTTTPCWASAAPDSVKQGCSAGWWDRDVQNYPPANMQNYADSLQYVLKRYGSKLAAVEVWNEPNFPTKEFWHTNDQAGDYTRLVKAAYPAAKAVAPSVPVLAGAIATADRSFLEQLYAHGIKGNYDGISIHPYNEWRDPADMWQDQWKQFTFLPGTQWIRQAQLAAGDNTPLWLTEFGWTTVENNQWHVSEEQQAAYVGKSFGLLASEAPYVKAAVIYNLRDRGTNKYEFNDNFGLVRNDYSPKPAYNALKSALATAGPAPTPDPTPVPNPAPTTPPPAGGNPSDYHGAEEPATETPTTPAKPPATTAPTSAITLTLGASSGSLYARGTAPKGSTVQVAITTCSRTPSLVGRSWSVKVDSAGKFTRNVGAAAQLSGCKVRATVRGKSSLTVTKAAS